ncbi:glycoside hydrolase family 43 protein [Paenibacillus sp. N4]|uniref:glycoside hydrolase family 43 protein n=1 Tax=Paenibacillus vietnamensis TaxID=2590547 RepID=UPI001CD13307|nr:glycoside hydrolase family 43 protein [Paenibacillus vietnamensis]MCA0757741.1 glycoside hydrolase family 43 protein [Paenibacillus vietnamensis]
MKATRDIQIRDPFVLPIEAEGKYYLFGSTDANIWGKGTGFDAYVSEDLEQWDGPHPVFRPGDDFFSDTNFWAPEVYNYQGAFYMFATFRRKDNSLLGTAVLVGDNPFGPFKLHSDGPVTPADWSSLDGSLHVDGEGQPWMVFCHEWQQVADGEVCAVRLSADLKRAVGEPAVLFRASEAPWTTPFIAERYPGQDNYVTDGPYLFRGGAGELYMLWAGFIRNQYALGLAKSVSGGVLGPWVHEEKALYQNDGGHGMVFRTFDGRLLLTIHTPNRTPDERPIFLEVREENGKITVAADAAD